MRREFLDQIFFWNGLDLQRKLDRFAVYSNGAFTPRSVVERPQSAVV